MPASLMVRQLALTRTKSKANLGGLGEDEVDSLRLLRLREALKARPGPLRLESSHGPEVQDLKGLKADSRSSKC